MSLVLHHLPDFALFFLFLLLPYIHDDTKNSYHSFEHFHFKKTPLHPTSPSLNFPFAFGLSKLWLSLKDMACFDALRMDVVHFLQFHMLRVESEVPGLSLPSDSFASFLLFPHPKHTLKLTQFNYTFNNLLITVIYQHLESHCTASIEGFNACHYLGFGHSVIIYLHVQQIFLEPDTLFLVLDNNIFSCHQTTYIQMGEYMSILERFCLDSISQGFSLMAVPYSEWVYCVARLGIKTLCPLHEHTFHRY